MTDGVLEYLYESHKAQCSQEKDLICLVFHCYLLKKGARLKNAGGMLPEDWNSQQDGVIKLNYTLDACNDGKKAKKTICISLAVLQCESSVFLTVTNPDAGTVGQMDITATDYITISKSTVKEIYHNIEAFEKELEEKIWKKIFPPNRPAASPFFGGGFQNPPPPQAGGPFSNPYRMPGGAANPYGYGRDDLDPFGLGRNPLDGAGLLSGRGPPGSGGMIFDPRRMPAPGSDINPGLPDASLPPGAVPPGARFDPFGPPGMGGGPRFPSGSRHPDPDFPQPPNRFGGGGNSGFFM